MYGYIHVSASEQRSQSDPLELDWQAVVSLPDMGIRIWTQALYKSNTFC